MAVKCVWLVQFNTPNELNVILEQIGERLNEVQAQIDELEEKSGTFYTYDWEEDYL